MAITGRCCCHATSNGNRSPLTDSWISPFTGRCGRATDPPLTSIVAMAAARRNGARLVNWIQDIYPETAVGLGVPFMRGPFAAKPDDACRRPHGRLRKVLRKACGHRSPLM